jgi:hypothetical protein
VACPGRMICQEPASEEALCSRLTNKPLRLRTTGTAAIGASDSVAKRPGQGRLLTRQPRLGSEDGDYSPCPHSIPLRGRGRGDPLSGAKLSFVPADSCPRCHNSRHRLLIRSPRRRAQATCRAPSAEHFGGLQIDGGHSERPRLLRQVVRRMRLQRMVRRRSRFRWARQALQ